MSHRESFFWVIISVVFVEMGGSMLFYSISSSQSLKRRKLELSTDIDSLTATADQLAEKAESSRDMSILLESNAMRKVCKEKTAEMTELDKQLADKVLEQKNCE